MSDSNDWRIIDPKKYLQGKELIYTQYHANSKDWDHDHCEFCWRKFIEDSPGYCTKDEYHWICEECYSDFKTMFQWKLIR